MVGEDAGDAMCMARRRLEEAAYAFWFLECRKKSKSCLFYCMIYYYYFALLSHDLINRSPLPLSFPIISGSYNELASVMEAGLEGKFPKSGMGELGGGRTKVRAQIQAE